MSHPGNFPGDPAGWQPAWQPPPGPGAYEYPPIDGAHWPPPGHPPPSAYYPPPYPPPPRYVGGHGPQVQTNGPAIGSLVSALVAIPAYFLCFGFVGSILGIVLGIVAVMQIGKTGQKGKGMAIAGIVLGALGLFGMGIVSALFFSPSLWI